MANCLSISEKSLLQKDLKKTDEPEIVISTAKSN